MSKRKAIIEKLAEAAAKSSAAADDVVVVSFPRAGRHLTRWYFGGSRSTRAAVLRQLQ